HHLRLQRHRPGEDRGAGGGGCQGRPEPHRDGRAHARGRRRALTPTPKTSPSSPSRSVSARLTSQNRNLERFRHTSHIVIAVACLVLSACGSTSTHLPLERAVGTLPATTAPPTTTAPTTAPPPPATVPPANAIMSPHGFALPVDSSDPRGWLVETPCGNKTTLTAGSPITTPTVILDPGHGGGETGAIGPNHLREAVLNMAVSQFAKSALQTSGVSVILTRPGDDRVVLTTRSALVRKLRPAAFVSVHHNSSP